MIPADAAQTLRGVVDRPWLRLPNCVCSPGTNHSVRTQLDSLAATSPDHLVHDVLRLYRDDEPLPEYWQRALHDPRRWLAAFATAMAVAWQALAPAWRETKAVRIRETERVGVAVVSGAFDALLASVNPPSDVADRALHFPDANPYQVRLGPRRLVLVPEVSGSSMSVFSLDEPDLVWFAYPAPGVEHLHDSDATPPSHSSLKLLLGPIKARLLQVLTHPFTMGVLADRLRLDPSTATYHCKQLVNAGLVARTQAGRQVRVWRTPRGDALIDLLS
ncbi:winged helix-turn-helix transcriptional regulator [Kribbella sandramycini]|uniref:Winged helix-turn-helix transcriptional regulator n=1 Tax=Kribbella sandramycini TaxID=60450 RepID=A0A7Y4P229_9ACTN|nr:winged helix-turn-helix domain-containing protein [Kribbella sandramycini]MBB6566620.1 hypothetical protein [Kribbella sandramycini]NOL42725.1 winged helix-turn-helix transcriptional regulator [Kribbella sandramycini]